MALGVLVVALAATAQPLQRDRDGSGVGVAATSAATVGCGESWQTVTPVPTSRSLLAMTWTGTQFVAVGALGTVVTSPDGASWTLQNQASTTDLAGVAWSGGQLVAVGQAGTIVTSPDGVTWTSHSWGVPFDLLDVVWANAQFVAVGYGGEILTSPDGATWTSRSSPTPYALAGVAWTGAQLVAVAQHGVIATSPDGAAWTLRSSGTSTNLASAAWTGARIVAVGDNGTVLTSPDGIAWSAQVSGTANQLLCVAWAGSRLVAVGALGTVVTSPDGIAWTAQSSGTTNRLNGVAWSGTLLAAVGGSGTIVTSACATPCTPATITSQPQSQNIPSGQTATLSVTGAGTTPLAYQWYQGASGDTSHAVGGNASTFTTPALTAATSYWVRVSNACGQVDSATATVSVNITPPAITAGPQSQTIPAGQTATLTVSATGTEPLSYQWYQGVSGNTSTPVGTSSRTYTTPALSATTSYWVRVSNSAGHADSVTATITTVNPPTITAQPQSQSIQSGATATLSVAVTGTPPFSYQWYRGASGDTSTPVGAGAGTFTTPALAVTTSFWVRVSNFGGHTDSATAVVTIVPASPAITAQPQSQSVQSGQAATLSVTATGAPPLVFQWYQGASGDTSNPVGSNASTFTTPPLTSSTSYWVRVSNSDGQMDSATAEVTVGPQSGHAVWVPVASHNPGKNESQWRSDLGLLNTGAVTTNVEIRFFGSDGVVSNTTSVAPGTQAILTDVVGQLGGASSGALQVLSDQPIKVTARSYNQVSPAAACYANGTQGQDYPAVAASDGLAAGQSAYLGGLTENATYRCNIGVVNTGGDAALVLVELFDGAGGKLADYAVSLAAGQWRQETQPYWSLAAQTAMDRGYARVTVQTGSGVFAFASVIDNVTNDPTTVAMQR